MVRMYHINDRVIFIAPEQPHFTQRQFQKVKDMYNIFQSEEIRETRRKKEKKKMSRYDGFDV